MTTERDLHFERSILESFQSGILDETALLVYADWLDEKNPDAPQPGIRLRSANMLAKETDLAAWANVLEDRPLPPLIRMLYANSVQQILPEKERQGFLKFVLEGALAELATNDEERASIHMTYAASPNERQYVAWVNAFIRHKQPAEQFQNIFFTEANMPNPQAHMLAESADEPPEPDTGEHVQRARRELNFLPVSGRFLALTLRDLDEALAQAQQNPELDHERILDPAGERSNTAMIIEALIAYARREVDSLRHASAYRNLVFEYLNSALDHIRSRDPDFDVEHALDPDHERTNGEIIADALIANARGDVDSIARSGRHALTTVGLIDDALSRAHTQNPVLDIEHALDPAGQRTNGQVIGSALVAHARQEMGELPKTHYKDLVAARISQSTEEALRRNPGTMAEVNRIVTAMHSTYK